MIVVLAGTSGTVTATEVSVIVAVEDFTGSVVVSVLVSATVASVVLDSLSVDAAACAEVVDASTEAGSAVVVGTVTSEADAV